MNCPKCGSAVGLPAIEGDANSAVLKCGACSHRGSLGDWKELAELRAYRDRTEAALREFSEGINTYFKQELIRLGLWREGGA